MRSGYFLINENSYNNLIFLDFLTINIDNYYTNVQNIIGICLNNNLFKVIKQYVYGTLFFGGLNDR